MFEWIKRALGAQKEPQKSFDDFAERGLSAELMKQVGVFLQDRSNGSLSETQILEELHQSPIFYACVSLIASQVAGTDIYPEVNGEIRRDHPLQKWLQAPNEFHSKYTFLWLVTSYLMTSGNCYIYVYDNGDTVTVPPNKVEATSTGIYKITIGSSIKDGYLFGEKKNLVKLTIPDLREPILSGTGLGSALSREIDIAGAAQKHELSTLYNNARPDMLVHVQGPDQKALNRLQEEWDRKNKGPENAGKTAFLTGTSMSATTLNSSFQDLGFIELREFSNDTIRRTYGIPPELLGKSENSNRATIDAAYYVFAKMVLQPRLRQILDALNKDLLPLLTKDTRVRLAHEEVVPDDKEFSLSAMQNFPQAYTVNEVRAITGHRPVVDGHRPLVGEMDLTPAEEEATQEREDPQPQMVMSRLMGSMPEEMWFASLESELREKRINKCQN